MISFTLSVCPESTQHGNRMGRFPKGKRIVYSDKKKQDYQFLVAAAARQYAPRQPLMGPIRAEFTFILPRPARLMRKSDFDGWIPHIAVPDTDNLEKGTKDALSKAGFWKNDSQVYDAHTRQFYAEKKGDPRIIVKIEEVA